MRRHFFVSLWVAFVITLGFYIPDYIKGVYDRADAVVPLLAFGTAFLTLTFYGEEK